jgi:glycosyltransferase involved in cell wall biosynthesis
MAFLRILQTLRQQNLPVVGLIVGGDDPKRLGYRKELDAAVQKMGLQDAVLFTGHRSDMREIYSVSKAVLSLSSKPESFGRTALEALSLGVPVVGYAHGGVGEILRTLHPGGAVAPRDEAGVVGAVARLFGKSVPAVKRNQAFLLATMQQQTLAVYRELVPT